MSDSSRSSAPILPSHVRSLFARTERAAGSDFLRREIAGRMHERLALVKIAPERVLDAGCGSGADLAPLRAAYPESQLLGLDGAYEQLALAGVAAAPSGMKRLLSRVLPGKDAQALLCADFAALPLAPNSVDLVWSNLALHWHPQPDRVFAEWRRVMRLHGLLMFSCFGPDTLRQLRTAFEQAGLAPPLPPFVDMHDFGDMLVGAGFATPVMDMETITVTYRDTASLLADVRALGGNPLDTRARGLTGKSRWRAMLDALEAQRGPDGTIALGFEVVYGHAFRPQARTTAAGETIVRLELPSKRR
ncbi:MAG TPA: methyltransferase domain-containing protein [Burkholderiaceae bacterium]